MKITGQFRRLTRRPVIRTGSLPNVKQYKSTTGLNPGRTAALKPQTTFGGKKYEEKNNDSASCVGNAPFCCRM